MNVADIMTAPVVVTQKERPLSQAIQLLDRKNLNALPVLSADGTIEGIVTRADLLRESETDQPVEVVMARQTHVVTPGSRVQDAAKMMLKHRVHHLVVMDEGQVVGMVSSMDFVGVVAES